MNYDYSLIYGGKVGKKRRPEYFKRLAMIAEHFTNGDLSHAAILVDNWKNGCFEEGDENLSFVDQTFKAIDKFERVSLEVGTVRRFLESKTLYGVCYEFSPFAVSIYKLEPDGTLGDQLSIADDERYLDIQIDKEEIEVRSSLNTKSPNRAIYKLHELELFYRECLEPRMKSSE